MRKMVSEKDHQVKSLEAAWRPPEKTTLCTWSVRKGGRKGARKLVQLNWEEVQEDILLHEDLLAQRAKKASFKKPDLLPNTENRKALHLSQIKRNDLIRQARNWSEE